MSSVGGASAVLRELHAVVADLLQRRQAADGIVPENVPD